ncbi:TraB/GumN family protein [Aurantiacibacter marinus]|uniref:TraB/GumN family protein n=1 Tax=Aurantiacibacter marinus TaxID=874156 RepID=UPI0022B1EDF6|nr:TraB/GumN family protein [Aurantiacibacter marinus]
MPPPSPALWEATGPESERVWLFGTIHALPDDTEWRTPALERVLAETDLLLVEIADLGEREQAALAFEARAYDVGLVPILDRVPGRQKAMLAASLDAAGIDPASLIHTETWAAALQLGNAARCSNAANGVDRALLARFDNARSLESFDRQFAVFDGLPDDAQADLLVSVAEESDCRAGNARRAAWLAGDLQAIETSILTSFRGNTDLRENLVDDRNAGYADQIVQFQASDPGQDLLVAVGVGHMLGETGLPALLSARGYRVRRIQ